MFDVDFVGNGDNFIFDPATRNIISVGGGDYTGTPGEFYVQVRNRYGALLYDRTFVTSAAFRLRGNPVEIGHNTWIMRSYDGTKFYRFRLDNGDYIDTQTVPADLGIDDGGMWGIATQKLSGKSMISVMVWSQLFLFRYNGGDIKLVGECSGMGHVLTVTAMAQDTGERVWTYGESGFTPGTSIRLRRATWENSPDVDTWDMQTLHGITGVHNIFYYEPNDAIILVGENKIIKVSASDPTTLINTLTLALASPSFDHSKSSQMGIQADGKFVVAEWEPSSGPRYVYYIINAATLTVVDLYYSTDFSEFLLTGFAPSVTYFYPEEIVYAWDETVAYNNYFLSPGPSPVGALECFKIRTVDFEVPGSAVKQFITTPDLENDVPKAVLICLSGATTENTETADIRVGIGAADADGQWALATIAKEGGTTIDTKRFAQQDACILLCSESVITHEASFVSFIAGGIEINWSEVGVGMGFVIFFGGSSLSAKVGRIINPERDDGSEIDVGFSPDLIYVASNFLKFQSSDDRFGISQGWFSKNEEFQSIDSPYAGKDGESTLIDTPAGLINRKHFTHSTTGQAAIDFLSGDTAAPPRGELIVESKVDGFIAIAMNGLSALRDYGYLALSFGKRARISHVRWDMSAKADGVHTEYHNNAEIEVLEALIMMPAPSAHLGETANLGLACLAGLYQNSIIGRGSATLSGGVYGKTVCSVGTFYIPTALEASGSMLQMAFAGFTEGGDGWEYELNSGPENDRAFSTIVIGRLEDCFPLAWHQAQLMENL